MLRETIDPATGMRHVSASGDDCRRLAGALDAGGLRSEALPQYLEALEAALGAAVLQTAVGLAVLASASWVIASERYGRPASYFVTWQTATAVVGLDHPGIVRDVSDALASRGVNIEELETETSNAPMDGGTLFTARAVLGLPAGVSTESLRDVLEELAHQLLVDIELDEADAD